MKNHTPAPWQVAENIFGNTCTYEVYTNVPTKSGMGGYTRICEVTPRDQKANANLIAAAPDLLEACELVLMSDDLAVRDVVRAAIAKAKGMKQ